MQLGVNKLSLFLTYHGSWIDNVYSSFLASKQRAFIFYDKNGGKLQLYFCHGPPQLQMRQLRNGDNKSHKRPFLNLKD